VTSGYRKGSTHADSARRVSGANGSWPAARDLGVRQKNKQGERGLARIGAVELRNEPKPPAIGYLYEDLNERARRVPKAVFGQYPRTLIPKLLPWLQCERHEILHVCSGALPPGEGIRVDIRPEAHPDILADGRDLPLADGSVAAVMLDPPYTKDYARDLYSVEYPRPSHLLREAARVVRPNGRIAFVHYIVPNPPPFCRFVRAFGLSVGFGFPMRAVTIYVRLQPELDLGGGPRRDP
jgi:SAM-dependent methyltransferase